MTSAGSMLRTLPRLHVVTDDAVLADPRFLGRSLDVLACGGAALALHLRGHATPARVLHDLAETLAFAARETGALLVVNDRIDIALAVAADGIQIGQRSVPVVAARMLVGDRLIGYSAHDPNGALTARQAGTDFLILGTIYASESHAGQAAAGVELMRAAVQRVDAPLLAIGGITPARVAEVRAAGGYGVAVVSGVWRAEEPVPRVHEYLAALAGS
jgi:thiamine-phosphate diphosphorylase